MDLTTITGLILGAVLLVASLWLGHVDPQILLRPEAILMVFGGTFTALLISFSGSTLSRSFKALNRCFVEDSMTHVEALEYLMEVAHFVRVEGMLSLQSMLPEIELPFLSKGLQLVLDNRNENFIRESLATEIEATYREEMDDARVFEAAGGFAPTMGIVGAVIGLMQVVQNFQNPAELAQGVAGAFSATLYGVAMANLFLLPIAGKLKQRAKDQWFRKTLLLEGIMSVRSGDHPMITEEKLRSFVSGVPRSSEDFRGNEESAGRRERHQERYADQLIEV